ncbi:hypothetical protein F5Y00DRAFT_238409 [Daldinia vernicosa]|uniref:uncharacterized protein n=1 Tax=Daldinia vernicosa TaxID=114800 RepID=UPI002008AD7A|nr:uncharacterized protein F5Y00DRAFT_238409 [Daldinia vernicosa]KAI0848471.1 hypothetical protein F5Y00DRAFT_238409 [Daldinia vernicosa]
MELTPIKVRGKRRLGNEAVVATPKKKSKTVGKSKLHKSRRSRESKASYLEKIPLEILERILWYSENVNLPRSSPLIGRLLSGRSTLRETFIVAFQPTWDAWFGCVGDRNDSTRPTEGNPDFQSGLLEYPWTNISFILESWDFYVRRLAKAQRSGTDQPFHFQHVRIWGDPDNPANIMAKDDSNVVDSQEASRCFFHDYAAFRAIEEHNGYYLRTFRNRSIQSTFLQVHKDTRIPDSLFTSPHSDEKIQKLFWLVRGGARLSPDQTWELTLQSFRDAVPETLPHVGKVNITMIRLLYILGAYQTWPEYVSNDETGRMYSAQLRCIRDPTAGIEDEYEYIIGMMSRGNSARMAGP